MRSDTGNNTVIMKKEEYLNEMHKMLQNKDIYQLLNKDPTSRFEKLASNLIMKLRKESIITEEIEKNMKSYNSVAPKIYGLRKTHKQSLALRPVHVFDNTDHNVGTLDGHNTYYCLGGIIIYTPEEKTNYEGWTKKLKNALKISAATIASQSIVRTIS
ncbi:hypothetical protein M0804_006613 [Polistes exclamans]|nr:hypothetical protein M0804_006613 [Polistes exclamans]